MRVENFIKDSAAQFADKVAVISADRRMSYGELDGASDKLAASLVHQGISRGDRVALFMSNSLEAVIAVFAVQKAGAVFVPLHPSTKQDRLVYILQDCQVRAVICEDRFLSSVDVVVGQVPSLRLVINAGHKSSQVAEFNISFQEAVSRPGTPPENPGSDVDLSAIIYTSGSTGRPKGVMMSHKSTVMVERSIAGYLEHSADDTLLSVLPLSSSYGLNQVFLALSTGATLVLEKSFAFPQAIVTRLKEHKVTGLALVPTMVAMILQMKGVKAGDFPHLRYLTNAAAALPLTHINKLQKLFPGVAIYSMYGQTECRRGTWMPPEKLHERPDSVGIAIPGTLVHVVDGQGAQVGPGETGELVIRGAHLMDGYWNDEAATSKALRPCLLPDSQPDEKQLHTGDLFRVDEEGYLYFVARKDDIIKTKGEKVAPCEVESVLHELDEVGMAVVIGVPDPVLGQVLTAVVVPAQNAQPDVRALFRHCARRLEDFKVPASIEFRNKIPQLANGKIQRRLLKQQIMENVS